MVNIGGKKINNWWLIGGGGAAVGIWWLYSRSASSSSASTTAAGTSANSIDPVTGLPYSQDDQVDPITGMTYLAEAQEYGSVTAAEQEITSGSAYYGDTGAGAAVDSGYPTIAGVTDTGSSTGNSYSTNAAWAQAVTAGLTGLGYSSTDVAAALGLFFAGQQLGSGADGVSYASIIQAAEAEFGPPPQGTYSIISAPSSSTPTSGQATGTPTSGSTGGSGSSGKTVKVPSVVGKTVNAAHSALTSAGLSYNTDTAKDKAGYDRIVTASNPKAGTAVAAGTHVGLTWHYVKQ